jgi:hypothetical protein
MDFHARFQSGCADAAVLALHPMGENDQPLEQTVATVVMHLVNASEADATIILAGEAQAKDDALNDLLTRLNTGMRARGRRTIRHAEIFVQGRTEATLTDPIRGFRILSSVETPSSYRLWLKESAGETDDNGPVTCMVDVLLTNDYMVTLVIVPFDARQQSEEAIRALVQWLVNSLPFLASRRDMLQEFSIRAHPSRYVGGADIKINVTPASPQAAPAPTDLPEQWPGLT